MTGEEKVSVLHTFDDAFCKVTQKIARLSLHKVCIEDVNESELLSTEYREKIQTHGYINSVIVCQFSEELFRYITQVMNGNKTPSEEEIHLYLNEYINIACGYAVSRINDTIGESSRLSVPRFYPAGKNIEDRIQEKKKKILSYHSEKGTLHVVLFYSLKDQEEGD